MSAGSGVTDNAEKLLALLGSAPASQGLLGGQLQASNTKVSPARTNFNLPAAGVLTNTAIQAVEVGNFVLIPVTNGDVFKTVGVLGGTASAATVAEYITGIYEGKAGGKLLAQSKSVTPGSHPKEEFYTAELESAVSITAANAPYGYVYAYFSNGAAGTQFSCYGATYTKALQEGMGKISAKITGAPEGYYFSGGSSIKTAAPATVPTLTVAANVPFVALY